MKSSNICGCRIAALLLSSFVATAPCPAFAAQPIEQWTTRVGALPLFDAQTLLKKWEAGSAQALPGASVDRLTEFRPAFREQYKLTGKTGDPVPVVRCSPGTPTFDLDFGELPIGCYVVRVIAAVKSDDVETYRKPLYIDLKVNDRVGGAESYYRHRVPYWDSFYAVTELYFNADENRRYHGKLSVGNGSIVDLYMHSIELHDVLARLPRKAAKARPSFFTVEEHDSLRRTVDAKAVWEKVGANVSLDDVLRPGAPALNLEERQKRDDLLWNAFPPINSQFVAEYDEGFASERMRPGEMSADEAAEKYGTWTLPVDYFSAWRASFVFHDEKLKIQYTYDDLANHRPLPDPYPFKDDGMGVYFPKTGALQHAEQFLPLATLLGRRWEAMWTPLACWHGNDIQYRLPYLYHALNNQNAARDAALLLCKWAYIYPTHTDAQTLGYALIAPSPQYDRDMRLVVRAPMFYTVADRGANLQGGLAMSYDYLFDFIQGNQELAAAVGRFIPWVKSDKEVRQLIETRILQFGAKQAMRFHLVSDKSHSVYLMRTAVVQQDAELTRPWVESLWHNTRVYPHPACGLPDVISTTTQRDGSTDIGSVFYSWGGSPLAATIEMARRYVVNGGDKKYDLSNPGLYGKVLQSYSFPIESTVAGGFPMTIGDVGDPAKPRLLTQIKDFEGTFRVGWNHTGDPRLAWLLKNILGRREESDAEWKRIEEASARQGRNPFLAQRSRVMANWAGVLEAGEESDDFRAKRAAFVRVGYGHGHAHSDTLDLQVIALGCRMVNDLGYRGGYNFPDASHTITHNRIEVNGKDHPRNATWIGHSWVSVFKPLPEAQYLEAIATPTFPNVKSYTRSVALVDAASIPKDQSPTTGTCSYIFDVQRMEGGVWPTFCFHGNWSDDFTVNLQSKTAVGQGSVEKQAMDKSMDGIYLRKFLDGPGLKYAGDPPADGALIATWRLRRSEATVEGFLPHTGEKRICKQINAEKLMLGDDYDESASRKFTRLHLLGCQGQRILVGQSSPMGSTSADASWPFLMVQNRSEDGNASSVYGSVIEPYSGQPFIASVKQLEIADNQADAQRAVAMEVKTTNGLTDLCYSDPRMQKHAVGAAAIEARFVLVSRDARGIRLIHLVEGRELRLGSILVRPADDAYAATIVAVDYPKKTLWLDRKLPSSLLAGEQVEIGNDRHKTSFTIIAARVEGNRTALTLDKPLDLSYATIQRMDVANKKIWTNIGPAVMPPGMNEGLTCSNEEMTKSWKCRVAGYQDNGYLYQLEGELGGDDLPVGGTFRLWECGVNDGARLPCHVHLCRVDGSPDRYELRADTGMTLKNQENGKEVVVRSQQLKANEPLRVQLP